MKRFTSSVIAVSVTFLGATIAQANNSNERALPLWNTPFPSLSAAGDGPKLGGYILVHYGDDDDGAEMRYRAIRLEMTGNQGPIQYAVSADFNGTIDDHDVFDDEAVSLKDSYVAWSVTDSTTATFGRFKEPILHSGLHSSSRRLMVERTNNGGDFDDRNAGFMLNGGSESLQWWVAMQEGGDGAGAMDDTQATFRAVYNFMGSAFGKYQGAYGYEGDNLSIGMASVEDDSSGLDATAIEVGYVSDGWALYGDKIDEDGGDSPTSITLSHLMSTEYEIGLRMEKDNDMDETSRLIAGINWYQGLDGHNLKWQLNFTESESDNPANEGTRVDVGLVWRF